MGCNISVPEIEESVENKSNIDKFYSNLKEIQEYIKSGKDSSIYLAINDSKTFRGENSKEFLESLDKFIGIMANIRQINCRLNSATESCKKRLKRLEEFNPDFVDAFVADNAIIFKYPSSETNKDAEEMIALYKDCRSIRSLSTARMINETSRNKTKITLKSVIGEFDSALKEAA